MYTYSVLTCVDVLIPLSNKVSERNKEKMRAYGTRTLVWWQARWWINHRFKIWRYLYCIVACFCRTDRATHVHFFLLQEDLTSSRVFRECSSINGLQYIPDAPLFLDRLKILDRSLSSRGELADVKVFTIKLSGSLKLNNFQRSICFWEVLP
jgi:hypothetical protein